MPKIDVKGTSITVYTVGDKDFNYGGFAIVESLREHLGWDICRNLTKINYRIHTNNIKTRMTKLIEDSMQFDLTINAILAPRPHEGTL
jgi:hypothetical protein